MSACTTSTFDTFIFVGLFFIIVKPLCVCYFQRILGETASVPLPSSNDILTQRLEGCHFSWKIVQFYSGQFFSKPTSTLSLLFTICLCQAPTCLAAKLAFQSLLMEKIFFFSVKINLGSTLSKQPTFFFSSESYNRPEEDSSFHSRFLHLNPYSNFIFPNPYIEWWCETLCLDVYTHTDGWKCAKAIHFQFIIVTYR